MKSYLSIYVQKTQFPFYKQAEQSVFESRAVQVVNEAQTQTLLSHRKPNDKLRLAPQNIWVFFVFYHMAWKSHCASMFHSKSEVPSHRFLSGNIP